MSPSPKSLKFVLLSNLWYNKEDKKQRKGSTRNLVDKVQNNEEL